MRSMFAFLVLAVFQFPPNGKAHVNSAVHYTSPTFQNQFQFPPNGKAHVNNLTIFLQIHRQYLVSIPSEREGTCERGYHPEWIGGGMSLVSIPSKREGTCERIFTQTIGLTKCRFQFPPNGKAHVNSFHERRRG